MYWRQAECYTASSPEKLDISVACTNVGSVCPVKAIARITIGGHSRLKMAVDRGGAEIEGF